MFAVIFEVNPRPEAWDEYLGHAAILRPELLAIDGFIANERYASLGRPGWLVSLSIWRDEKALIRWRTHALHHEVQGKGRASVFADYRLRVGEIVSDTQATEPLPQSRFDTTEVSAAKAVSITERPLDPGLRTTSPGRRYLRQHHAAGQRALYQVMARSRLRRSRNKRDTRAATAWCASSATTAWQPARKRPSTSPRRTRCHDHPGGTAGRRAISVGTVRRPTAGDPHLGRLHRRRHRLEAEEGGPHAVPRFLDTGSRVPISCGANLPSTSRPLPGFTATSWPCRGVRTARWNWAGRTPSTGSCAWRRYPRATSWMSSHPTAR